MFSRIVVRIYVALVAGVIIGGLASHNLTGADILPAIWFALWGLGGIMMVGQGLYQLGVWINDLPSAWFVLLFWGWPAGWIIVGLDWSNSIHDQTLSWTAFIIALLISLSMPITILLLNLIPKKGTLSQTPNYDGAQYERPEF